jgi:alkylresorcinol/alkylpyrone synthase
MAEADGNAHHHPVARIASVATAVPDHVLTMDETIARATEVFRATGRGATHIEGIIRRCGIERRHVVLAPDDIVRPRSLEETSKIYRDHSMQLATRAVEEALARAGLEPGDIDHVITVSCTGLLIPSLDALLMNALPFRRDCRRTPITELGCAAGAVGLSRAADHLRARPGETVLLVAVELSSLTFQLRDRSLTNLVASVLFADGAAAAVITDRDGAGPTVIDTRSELFPDTEHIMGFELMDGGLHIRLDRELAPLLEREMRGALAGLLAPHRMTPRDLGFFVLHPGGRRLLEVMQQQLGIDAEAARASWDVLRDYGNMSSATVLFVLERVLLQRHSPGTRGLLAAFGPGFSAELLLLQWN